MPSYVLRTPAAPRLAAAQALGPQVSVAIATPELVPRNCTLGAYAKQAIPDIAVSDDIIAYASPDSTYHVTKKLIDAAKVSILIGIYDFTAPHMQELLLAAMARRVRVSLMLDLDGAKEGKMFDHLVEMGATGVEAPSCANPTVRIFRSSHEKVIVIDGEWSLVQSGNYSSNSIPLNPDDGGRKENFRTGNRDTGLAIRSKPLAKLMTKILEGDMAMVTAVPQMLRRQPPEEMFLVEAAPRNIPKTLFPSKTFSMAGAPLTLTPVLSPDNYMEVMPGHLKRAKTSIVIEQQYIRATQPNIKVLLQAMKAAKAANPQLEIKIVLGKIFDKKDIPKERANLDVLEQTYGLKLGEHIRYINTDQFEHCHNKMILVDGEGVLVSSQNWSQAAVTENREAGIWLKHRDIAGYFRSIFDHDWKHARKTLPVLGAGLPAVATPQALGGGGFVEVELGDYAEV